MNPISEAEIHNRLKTNIHMTLQEPYKGTVREYHLFKCNTCNGLYHRRLDHVFEGRGCPMCKNSMKLTENEINSRLSSLNIKLHGHYDGNQCETKWICTSCNTIFSSTFNQLKMERKFCPGCTPKYYKNENITNICLHELLPNETIVKNYKINEEIKDLEGDVVKKYVFIDYCIKIDDTTCFVEYHGSQHYKPCKFWNLDDCEASEKFRRQKIRDEWVRNYCKNRNIQLLEINSKHYYGSKIKPYLHKKLLSIFPWKFNPT